MGHRRAIILALSVFPALAFALAYGSAWWSVWATRAAFPEVWDSKQSFELAFVGNLAVAMVVVLMHAIGLAVVWNRWAGWLRPPALAVAQVVAFLVDVLAYALMVPPPAFLEFEILRVPYFSALIAQPFVAALVATGSAYFVSRRIRARHAQARR